MKRSEMCVLLTTRLRSAYGQYFKDGEGKIANEMADTMIGFLENSGMLPPDEVDHDDDCPTYDGESCHGCVPRQLTRWEPEDEEK